MKKRRRVPAQDRSRERVARILDAAAHEFADHGVEASTIEAIAERAHTSVGSIYQFYPNKRAIYEAIGDQYLAEVRALFAVLVSEDAMRAPWREVVRATIDAFASLHRTSVTFRAIWSNVFYSRRFLHAGQALNRELAERAEVVFGRLAKKKIAPAHKKLLATVSIETLSALLLLSHDRSRAHRGASRGPGDQGDALLGEAKVIIERYLEPWLD